MKLGHVTPDTPLRDVLWSLRREALSSMSVPNLKQIALFVQKLLGGPKFRPTKDPFPAAHDGQNLISWRWSLPAPTDLGEDRCTQFRVIVVTDSHHTNKHTHRQDRLHYTAPRSLARSVTRSSADADNGLDAFVGQSRSTNISGPFQVK